MVKMVEQLISKFKVIGSTPTTLLKFFLFFIHLFIIFSIHDVSPAVVEACLKNSYCSIAQSKEIPMVQCHPRICTHTLVRPYSRNQIVYGVESGM